MKKLLLGIVLGLLAFPAVSDMAKLANSFTDSKLVEYAHDVTFIPGYGLNKAFDGSCTKDISKNGHGWVFVNREYFKCGKVSVVISDMVYGEYSDGEPTASQLKALEDFNKERNK